ncbi:MAG: hypothetical protein HOJ34_02145 [Kordiimonadaceae bacterium]|jgi:hypothetical protein|nr:hypothetical protein [Kordiimonadaceae bacterium]MBT6328558.1 hypothetical protein [Kordiimonadaceae bacterium]MBT7581888.1 hypothetical protein [Kordiimonadaceae bacterium]
MPFIIAISAPTKKVIIKILFRESKYGFFNSVAEFFANPCGWPGKQVTKLDIWENTKKPQNNRIHIYEFETEKYPERIGSGKTGLYAELHLNPNIHCYLNRLLPKTEEIDDQYNNHDKCDLVLITLDIDEFEAP